MATRDNPYGALNFMAKRGDAGGEDQIPGGASGRDRSLTQHRGTLVDQFEVPSAHAS